ncbi:hypothetical protein [Nostoc sp.]
MPSLFLRERAKKCNRWLKVLIFRNRSGARRAIAPHLGIRRSLKFPRLKMGRLHNLELRPISQCWGAIAYSFSVLVVASASSTNYCKTTSPKWSLSAMLTEKETTLLPSLPSKYKRSLPTIAPIKSREEKLNEVEVRSPPTGGYAIAQEYLLSTGA